MTEHVKIVIAGAGLAGLGLASRLRAAGETSFLVLEKEERVGGTWRDNTYPGAACDVPSHLYWFSFDEQPDWSHVYSPQAEILCHIERLVQRHHLARYIRCQTEVISADWNDVDSVWHLRLSSGAQIVARVFVGAWGQLNRPSFGSVQGQRDFAGTSFHSAQWRHDVSLQGKRIGVIGTGASAAQIVPQIVDAVRQLTLFHRSANYITPRMDRPYDPEERARFRAEPATLQASREAIYREYEDRVYQAMRRESAGAREEAEIARAHLESQIGDPELRRKLTPDYPIGCKRILVSDDFYPALTRPNLTLVTDRIDRIEAGGVRTDDGRLHAADVLIYATGFETLSFLGALEIRGRHSRSLREAWRDGPEAYLGMSVSGFPNFFMLYGPNTNLGHNSILAMLECQFGYVLQAVRRIAAQSGSALDLREEVMTTYNRALQARLAGSSWAGNCTSWYKTARGRITNNWPDTVDDYQQVTARFNPTEYEVIPRLS